MLRRIVWFEVLKTFRSSSWLVTVLFLFLLQAALLIAQFSFSDCPLIRYPQQIALIMNKAPESANISQKAEIYQEEAEQYDQAEKFRQAVTFQHLQTDDGLLQFDPSQSEASMTLLRKAGSDFQKQQAAARRLAEFYGNLAGYSSYLESAEKDLEDLKRSPMWNSYSDARKAALKTKIERYQSIGELQLSDRSPVFLDMLIDSSGAVIFLALCLITGFTAMNSDESGQADLLLWTAKNGRKETRFGKLFASCLIMSCLLVIYVLIELLVMSVLLPFPELTAPIQSYPAFYQSIYSMNTWHWLLVWVVMLWMSGSLIILLTETLWPAAGFGSLLFCLGLYGAGFLLYRFIPPQSAYSVLAWCNFYALVTPTLFFQDSQIWFSLSAEAWWFIGHVVLQVILLMLLLIVPYRQTIKVRALAWPSFIYRKVGLFRFQILLTSIHNPVFLFVIVSAAMIGIHTLSLASPQQKEQLAPSAAVFRSLQGKVSETNRAWLDAKRQVFQSNEKQLFKAGTEYQNGLISEHEYAEAIGQYQETLQESIIYSPVLSQYDEGTGWLLYPDGYQILFGIYSQQSDLLHSVYTSLMLIFLLYGLFSSDHENDQDVLYRTAAKGNKVLIRSRLLAAMLYSCCIFLLIYGLQLVRVLITFPMDFWNAPLSSIATMQREFLFPQPFASFPLWLALLFLELIRLIGTILMSFWICCISMFSPGRKTALLLSVLLILLPEALILLGFDIAKIFMVSSLIKGNDAMIAPWTLFAGLLWMLLIGFLIRQYSARMELAHFRKKKSE